MPEPIIKIRIFVRPDGARAVFVTGVDANSNRKYKAFSTLKEETVPEVVEKIKKHVAEYIQAEKQAGK